MIIHRENLPLTRLRLPHKRIARLRAAEVPGIDKPMQPGDVRLGLRLQGELGRFVRPDGIFQIRRRRDNPRRPAFAAEIHNG